MISSHVSNHIKKAFVVKCSVDIYGLFMLSQQEFRSKTVYGLASLLASSLVNAYGAADDGGDPDAHEFSLKN